MRISDWSSDVCSSDLALAVDLLGDVGRGQLAIMRLAAGHRHGVVEQNLVGDVDLGGDRGAQRQQAGMEIGAVPEIGEDVLFVGERCLADPDRKSTRLTPVTNAPLVCRLLLETKKYMPTRMT